MSSTDAVGPRMDCLRVSLKDGSTLSIAEPKRIRQFLQDIAKQDAALASATKRALKAPFAADADVVVYEV